MKARSILFVVCFFVLVCAASSEASEIHFARLIDVKGNTEWKKDKAVAWAPVVVPQRLRQGSRLRTGKGAEAEIHLDDRMDNVMVLQASSELIAQKNPPTDFTLKNGALFIFREKDRADGIEGDEKPFHTNELLKIFTTDALIQMEMGGCQITTDAKGTSVRVFSGKVSILEFSSKRKKTKATQIEEGFEFFVGRSGDGFERLDYTDYTDWQAWARKIYQKKDARASQALGRMVRL